jgi:AbiJ N-terminal domain 4
LGVLFALTDITQQEKKITMSKLWSKRQQQDKSRDIYQYDVLPDAFRGQVIHILVSTLGIYYTNSFSTSSSNERWKILFSRYTRERGVFHLGNDPNANVYQQCFQHIQVAPTEQALDFIVCAFEFINQDLRQDPEYIVQVVGGVYQFRLLDEAIEELNQRFREHQIGYQFQNGQLIKQTDQYLHEEVMLPALTLLSDPQFRGAQEEFLKAHQHFREQKYKEAVNEALKAFESTMKSILDERGWPYDKQKDTAKKLIDILLDKELIPGMLQDEFTGLRNLLASGLPTVRNKKSGHGQGATPVDLPEYIAEYALHMAAANIVFLAQAYKEYKNQNKQ